MVRRSSVWGLESDPLASHGPAPECLGAGHVSGLESSLCIIASAETKDSREIIAPGPHAEGGTALWGQSENRMSDLKPRESFSYTTQTALVCESEPGGEQEDAQTPHGPPTGGAHHLTLAASWSFTKQKCEVRGTAASDPESRAAETAARRHPASRQFPP